MDKKIASLEQQPIWPVTGQDLQNTKRPAVQYFDYCDYEAQALTTLIRVKH